MLLMIAAAYAAVWLFTEPGSGYQMVVAFLVSLLAIIPIYLGMLDIARMARRLAASLRG